MQEQLLTTPLSFSIISRPERFSRARNVSTPYEFRKDTIKKWSVNIIKKSSFLFYILEGIILFLLSLFWYKVYYYELAGKSTIRLMAFIIPFGIAAIVSNEKDIEFYIFKLCLCFAVFPAIVSIFIELLWGEGAASAVTLGIEVWSLNLFSLFWYHIRHNYDKLKAKGILILLFLTFFISYGFSALRNILGWTNIFWGLIPLYIAVCVYHLYLKRKNINFQ